MNAQTMTIISGLVFFVVFALAAWSLRRRRKPKGVAIARNADQYDEEGASHRKGHKG
ncbi:hypothetical protein [Desulfonatronum lacustre]|uniref:hypothetical protein n=1 Tax=Desulfonatronum lacustre TaxID=66849 RepID=UPI0004BB8E6F|nr:hypothetical protein [Desulfonatronum lacustre]